MSNCPNCGAPLRGTVCEYCGTIFKTKFITSVFAPNDWKGSLTIGDKTYDVYISKIQHKEKERRNGGDVG